jgi:hypothetical protein
LILRRSPDNFGASDREKLSESPGVDGKKDTGGGPGFKTLYPVRNAPNNKPIQIITAINLETNRIENFWRRRTPIHIPTDKRLKAISDMGGIFIYATEASGYDKKTGTKAKNRAQRVILIQDLSPVFLSNII